MSKNYLTSSSKNILDKIPTVGYMGNSPTYRSPIVTITKNSSLNNFTPNINPEENSIHCIPVVGYTGYRPKIRAENLHSKNFRDMTIQTKFS